MFSGFASSGVTLDVSQEIVSQLRINDETDAQVVSRAFMGFYSKQLLENAAVSKENMKFSLAELREVEIVVRQMMAAGFSSDKTTACCRALFVDMSDANLDDAFKYFDGGDGFLQTEKFKKDLALMGQDIAQDKIDKLFAAIDTNDNGNISSKEFKMLVKAVRGQEDLAFKFTALKNTKWEVPAWGLAKTGDKVEPAKDAESTETTKATTQSPSLQEKMPAWVKSMDADRVAFGTAWSAGLAGLGPAQMTKVGKVIHNMKDAGYSDEKANTVCKALFCKQSEDELRQAFEVFDDEKTGTIAAAEFGKLLKLLGEDVPADKVDDAFKEADTNKSGKLEYSEFCAVVRFLNPKSAPTESDAPLFKGWWMQSKEETPAEAPTEAPEETKGNTAEEKGAEVKDSSWWSRGGSPAQEDAKAESAPGEKEGGNELAAQQEETKDKEEGMESARLTDKLPAWVASMEADRAAFGTAWSAGLTGLGPAQMTKVGKVIHTMKDAGYSDEKANTVCKALFCEQSEEELKQAFEVLDDSKTGAIAGAEFGKLLKLLGEDVPPNKIDDAFKEVDTDKSGKLEYAEFSAMVRFLNPKSAPKEGSARLFGAWWTPTPAESPKEAAEEAPQATPQANPQATPQATPKEEATQDHAAGQTEAGSNWFSLGWSAQSTSAADEDGTKAAVSTSG